MTAIHVRICEYTCILHILCMYCTDQGMETWRAHIPVELGADPLGSLSVLGDDVEASDALTIETKVLRVLFCVVRVSVAHAHHKNAVCMHELLHLYTSEAHSMSARVCTRIQIIHECVKNMTGKIDEHKVKIATTIQDRVAATHQHER